MTLALTALLGSPAAASRDPIPVDFSVVVATTPLQAVGNIRVLTARLLDAQKTKDAAAYAAARLDLLENIALLQDWAMRAEDPASTADALAYRLTPEGRKALGTRKPKASDLAPRPGVAAKPRGPLEFTP